MAFLCPALAKRSLSSVQFCKLKSSLRCDSTSNFSLDCVRELVKKAACFALRPLADAIAAAWVQVRRARALPPEPVHEREGVPVDPRHVAGAELDVGLHVRTCADLLV